MAEHRFVFIAEGEVFMQLAISDDSNPRSPMWVAGLSSNPTVIDATNLPEVVPGWTYDGVNFVPPQISE